MGTCRVTRKLHGVDKLTAVRPVSCRHEENTDSLVLPARTQVCTLTVWGGNKCKPFRGSDAVRGDRQLQRVPAGGGRAVRAGGGPLHRQARAPAAGDRCLTAGWRGSSPSTGPLTRSSPTRRRRAPPSSPSTPPSCSPTSHSSRE